MLADFLLRSSAISERAAVPSAFDFGQTALRLAVLVFPKFSGTPLQNNYWVQSFTNFNEQTAYIGLLSVALAITGALFWRRNRLVLFFAVLGLLSLWLAIRAPGFQVVKALPLFNVGQGVRWAMVWSFCGAVLAGYGLDALLSMQPIRSKLRDTGLLMVAGALSAFGLMLLVYIGVRDHNWDRAWQPALTHFDMARLLYPAQLTLHWPAFFLAAGAAVVLARWRGLLSSRSMAVTLIVLLYSDLWVFGNSYNPVTPESAIYPSTTTTRFLADNLGHERFIGTLNTFRPNISMVFGFHDLRVFEDVVDNDFDTLYGPLSEVLDVTTKRDLNLSAADHRLLSIAGVRYVLTLRKPRIDGDARPYRWLFEEGRVATYENLDALPRAYVVYSATVAPNTQSAIGALLSPRFDPRNSMILTGGGSSLHGASARPAAVTWQKDDPEDVELAVDSPAPGFLVLSDLYAPGWEVTVDGQALPLLRANVVFRAVAVPAGRHSVAFSYRPPLFYTFAPISLTATLAVLGLALFALFRPPTPPVTTDD
jgi:hypothetical protein